MHIEVQGACVCQHHWLA